MMNKIENIKQEFLDAEDDYDAIEYVNIKQEVVDIKEDDCKTYSSSKDEQDIDASALNIVSTRVYINVNGVESKRLKSVNTPDLKHFPCLLDNLKKHINSTNSGEICQKLITWKSNFKAHISAQHVIHMGLHSGEKPFQCNICRKRFTLKLALTVHVRTHTGEKPYGCDVCNKRFSQNYNLKKHTLTHTGEKSYGCGVCRKRFTQKSHLKTHMHVHSGEKPYKCDICQKQFSMKYTFTVHMRIHTGEKPYECFICHKRFAQKVAVTIHNRIHT